MNQTSLVQLCNCALQIIEFSRVSFCSDCAQKQSQHSGFILQKKEAQNKCFFFLFTIYIIYSKIFNFLACTVFLRGTFPGVFVHRHCQQRVNSRITVAVVAVANVPLCFGSFGGLGAQGETEVALIWMRKQKPGSRATTTNTANKADCSKPNIFIV